MKCEKCGADIPAGAKTCPKCNAAAPKTPFRRIKMLTQLIKIRVRLPERKIQIPIPIRS